MTVKRWGRKIKRKREEWTCVSKEARILTELYSQSIS
jgi:hypothetical protein